MLVSSNIGRYYDTSLLHSWAHSGRGKGINGMKMII